MTTSPAAYRGFRESFAAISAALDELAVQARHGGPLDDSTQRLIKLGMAVASESPEAVRSNVCKALEASLGSEQIRHVTVLAITTCGLPTAITGMEWIDEVLAAGTTGTPGPQ